MPSATRHEILALIKRRGPHDRPRADANDHIVTGAARCRYVITRRAESVATT